MTHRAPAARLGTVRAAGRRAAGRRGDDGLSLIEVIIATSVLITVFIPVSLLLQSGVKAVGGDIHVNAASNIAAGVLTQEQTAAEKSSLGPPLDTTTPPAPFYKEKTAKKWVSPALQTQKVGDVTYRIYGVGGWCVLSVPASKPASWGDASHATTGTLNPAEYFVAVKVAWGAQSATPNAAGPESVTEYAPLVSQPAWSVPTASQLVADGSTNWCPVDHATGVL
ncbi:MAG: hypothetical protein M0Z95_14545 [Actinomycetota bacterium]|nr:hypothetical protein [Actinomycetota bacterium]